MYQVALRLARRRQLRHRRLNCAVTVVVVARPIAQATVAAIRALVAAAGAGVGVAAVVVLVIANPMASVPAGVVNQKLTITDDGAHRLSATRPSL
jgi:hypothetical protein